MQHTDYEIGVTFTRETGDDMPIIAGKYPGLSTVEALKRQFNDELQHAYNDGVLAGLYAIDSISGLMVPSVGEFYVLTRDVDRYPHFIAPEGTVVEVTSVADDSIWAVAVDRVIEGADTNEISWSRDIAEDNGMGLGTWFHRDTRPVSSSEALKRRVERAIEKLREAQESLIGPDCLSRDDPTGHVVSNIENLLERLERAKARIEASIKHRSG